MSEFNDGIIKEFRANHGKGSDMFAGSDMILLTTTGAKSGKKRTNPLVYSMKGDKYVIIASKGGADTHPDWFFNIKANPEAEAEVGDEKFKVKAEIVDEDERKSLYAKHAEKYPGFLDYQKKTDRAIPVILLERIN